MKFRLPKIFFFYLILLFTISSSSWAQDLRNDRNEGRLVYQQYKNRQRAALSKGVSKKDRGVGVLDRGELANVTGNFGVISNFHLFAPAFHWPSWADDTHQYCFGLELLVGVKGDVVSSIHDPATVAENFDWEALDGSLGNLFSGNVTVSDGTPLLASSDVKGTWPEASNGLPQWPGPFRLDPDLNKEVLGEFVSERDVYSIFTDQSNLNSPHGLKVIQTDYSFSRSYARNFLIFDFKIINTSQNNLDSVWVGYMSDFKVDFDAHDHIRFTNLSGNKNAASDLVYLWDADPSEGIWDITGHIGFLSLFTPKNKGITDFHYFDNIYEPSTNQQLWEIMSSDTSGRNITVSNYFHGKNYRIDDDGLADDMDPSGQKLGTDFVFIVSTGALSIAAGDTVHSAFAVVLGASEAEMLANSRMVKNMAQRNYLGPNAPRSPEVSAFPGNKKVTLTWDDQSAETSRDIISGKLDFEGYRVYRSEDFGQSWGNPITDEKGNNIGYVPIAQFDLNNVISGKDPNSNFFLGNNSGLKHTFVDSTVSNGVEYWYAVTSYDAGDRTTGVPALESPRGITPDERNLVSVIPAGPANGIFPATIPNSDSIPASGGYCESRLAVQILDPMQLTGHQYRVTFNDAGLLIQPDDQGNPDSSVTTTFNLVDLTTGDTLLTNHPLLNDTKDNIPVTDGFRVLPQDAPPGVTFSGWTKVNGDTCTFEWRTSRFKAVANHPWVGDEKIYTGDDYRITVDYTPTGGSDLQWYDLYSDEPLDTLIHVPLIIEMISDPQNPVNIASSSLLGEYEINAEPDWHNSHYSPLGWDLNPGGTGFNPNTPLFAYLWPDAIIPQRRITNPVSGLERTTGLYLMTQNYPDSYINQYAQPIEKPAVKPSQGDEFTIRTKKLFRSEIYYDFTTTAPVEKEEQITLDSIRVVPNPYIVRAGWERSEFGSRLQFTNLPSNCEIDIFTTAGDHVKNLKHNSPRNFEFWNLQNDSGVNVAYGLYIYQVHTKDGKKFTGRFVVIR